MKSFIMQTITICNEEQISKVIVIIVNNFL